MSKYFVNSSTAPSATPRNPSHLRSVEKAPMKYAGAKEQVFVTSGTFVAVPYCTSRQHTRVKTFKLKRG
jgi:hypothetical protein